TAGGFTRFVRVRVRCLHRIPEGVPFEYAALPEPACVAYNAIHVKSRVRPGEPVVIIGPGPIGLFALQMCRAGGAGPVVLVGTSADAARLGVGESLGAAHAIDSGRHDPLPVIDQMTGGEGAHPWIAAAGPSKVVGVAMAAGGGNGQLTKIAWGPKPLDVSLAPLLAKAASIQGTFSHTWRTWEAVLGMMAAGTIRMAPMITHRFTIEEWEKAYHLIEDR